MIQCKMNKLINYQIFVAHFVNMLCLNAYMICNQCGNTVENVDIHHCEGLCSLQGNKLLVVVHILKMRKQDFVEFHFMILVTVHQLYEHLMHKLFYFLSKVNIWNVNCARATAFIFDTRTGILVKVSKFLRQKMSRPEGDSNLRIHAECSNPLSYQGQTFAVPCFWTLALVV